MPFRSVRRKILLSLIAATLFFGVAMIVFTQTVLRRKLVVMLQEKGVAIARKAAADSVNPVITGRHFEIALMLKDLQGGEEDVVYAFIVSEDGRDLASTFAGAVPAALKRANPVDPLGKSTARELPTDKGAVLDIGVPLLEGQIGVLHLGLSLAAIRTAVNDIILLIVLFAFLALLLGSVSAVGFSRIITRPLLALAAAAETFGRGESNRPVAIQSNDEIGELARVFNAMIENRQRISAEREQLIAELRRTLGEVKTLRGFLPICSSCKKIRDDQGYWQQIESYIRQHSEAEFSHGICPECAGKLYPEIWNRIQKAGD